MAGTWADRLRGALATAPSASNPYPMVRVVDELCAHIKATGSRRVAPQLYALLRGPGLPPKGHAGAPTNVLAYIEGKCGPLERTEGEGATA